jgi:hypothetical protein
MNAFRRSTYCVRCKACADYVFGPIIFADGMQTPIPTAVSSVSQSHVLPCRFVFVGHGLFINSIFGSVSHTEGTYYHPECFTCTQCHIIIPIDENYGIRFGTIYCQKCYEAKRNVGMRSRSGGLGASPARSMMHSPIWSYRYTVAMRVRYSTNVLNYRTCTTGEVPFSFQYKMY